MSDTDDLAAIDHLVARFYAAFDNTRITPVQADIAGCFSEGARVIRFANGSAEAWSIAEFAAPRIALLNGGGLTNFSEHETHATTEQFGGIASRTSHYRKSGMLHGKPYAGSGTKLFHFVRLPRGWRVSALSWVDAEG